MKFFTKKEQSEDKPRSVVDRAVPSVISAIVITVIIFLLILVMERNINFNFLGAATT